MVGRFFCQKFEVLFCLYTLHESLVVITHTLLCLDSKIYSNGIFSTVAQRETNLSQYIEHASNGARMNVLIRYIPGSVVTFASH